jgi:hypothetical protein
LNHAGGPTATLGLSRLFTIAWLAARSCAMKARTKALGKLLRGWNDAGRLGLASKVDRRTLRGSPLRNRIGVISFGATVVGKMHTAGLRGEPLAAIQSEIRNEWLETLDRAFEFEALATIGVGLTQAMKTLRALQSKTSDFPVNLPVPDFGQPVQNLATEHDQSLPPGAGPRPRARALMGRLASCRAVFSLGQLIGRRRSDWRKEKRIGVAFKQRRPSFSPMELPYVFMTESDSSCGG